MALRFEKQQVQSKGPESECPQQTTQLLPLKTPLLLLKTPLLPLKTPSLPLKIPLLPLKETVLEQSALALILPCCQ